MIFVWHDKAAIVVPRDKWDQKAMQKSWPNRMRMEL